MQETNWFVAHPEVMRYILEHEQKQEQTFAAGECPVCSHDWSCHGDFIARGEKTCVIFDGIGTHTFYFDERHPYYVAEAIASECDIADELAVIVIQYDERDPIIHTDERPFCDDPACPCHGCETWEQVNYQTEHLEQPFDNGLLTVAEYHRLFWNKQL